MLQYMRSRGAAAMGYAKRSTAEYRNPEMSPTGRPTFYLDGPEDFLDHGAVVVLYDKTQNGLPRRGNTIAKVRPDCPVRKPFSLSGIFFEHSQRIRHFI
jgi:hypothetical protein